MIPRRRLSLAISLAVLCLGGAALAVVRQRPATSWTAASPAAIAEFEAGLADETRFYHREATVHYEQALRLDPAFLMPMLRLFPMLHGSDPARVEEMLEALREADLSAVTPRERLLVGFFVARRERRREDAQRLLAEFLARRPDDPFAVELACNQRWERHEWAEAEVCYRRLIEVDPNLVEAQNRLGYIAMAQGRFAEAEEQFKIYRYVAPDQPNPHDSLGELLVLRGRFGEADLELAEALAIKPDFCHSWRNRVQIELLRGDFAGARERAGEMARHDGCLPAEAERVACQIATWEAFTARDWPATVAAAGDGRGCGNDDTFDDTVTLAYQASLLLGREEVASAIEARLAEWVEKTSDKPGSSAQSARAALTMLRGTRLRLAGQPEQAAALLAEADRGLAYWAGGEGYLKLANRIEWAAALRAAGRTAEADRLLAEIRAVNRPLAETWSAVVP